MELKDNIELYIKELKVIEKELMLYEQDWYCKFSSFSEDVLDDYLLWNKDKIAWALSWFD